MKNLLLILVAILFFASCENIEREEPTLLAFVDNNFFDTNNVTGGQDEDYFIVIKGDALDGKITLRFKSPILINLPLGGESLNSATYEDAFGAIYSTGPNATGEVVITNRARQNTLSGDFSFTAMNASSDTIVVSGGLFYEIITRRPIVFDTP